MSPLDFVPKWVLAAIAALATVACVAMGFAIKGLELQVANLKLDVASIALEHSEAVIDAQARETRLAAEFRAKEQAMQDAQDKRRKVTDATITDLARERDALKLRLLQEATSTTDSPYNPGASPNPGLKGTLSGKDYTLVPWQTEFLIDEAFRADEIRVELLACYASYNLAKKTLEAKP